MPPAFEASSVGGRGAAAALVRKRVISTPAPRIKKRDFRTGTRDGVSRGHIIDAIK
jgi:hypothetical protein